MQRCRVLAPMAPQIMANLPLQKHHRVDQRTSETNAFLFPGAFANGSRHLPRSHKGAEKEKMSEGQAVWVHTNQGTHFNHFLSTATSSCAIPPTLAFHKRTKNTEASAEFSRHPGEEGRLHSTMIGCPAHQNRFRIHDPTICKENQTAYVTAEPSHLKTSCRETSRELYWSWHFLKLT